MSTNEDDRPYQYHSAGELDNLFVKVSNKIRWLKRKRPTYQETRMDRLLEIQREIDKERDIRIGR